MIVDSVAKDGTRFVIELRKIDDDEAHLNVRTWKPGTKPKSRPSKNDNIPLYNVKVDGNLVSCKAEVMFNDPDVFFLIEPGQVSITIRGAAMHNGTTTYSLDAAEVAALMAFVATF
jgi:hypothetical protein